MKTITLGTYKIENSIEESDKIFIEGYACHFNSKNLNMEIVDENSFKTFFNMYESKQITPILNYNHDSNWIIGGIDEIISDSTGLYMRSHINKGVKICDEMIIPNVMNGTLSKYSTEGYISNGYNGIVENEDGSYYVKDFILTATAIVPTPADPFAEFTLANYIKEYKLQRQEELNKIQNTSKTIFFI